MRITGTLHSIGHHQILTDGNPDDDETIEDRLERFTGILITANEATLRAASNLLCATVDIYPHPVNGLVAGECTPENYAHALARLAHAEDHLAREVRSSQALTMLHNNLRDIADSGRTEATDLRTEVKRLRRVLHKHDISADTSGEEFDGMREGTATLEAQHTALLAKQAEQERLLSIYRTKYHEADRALQQAHADLAALQAVIREYEADDVCHESTLGTVQTPTPTFDDEGNET